MGGTLSWDQCLLFYLIGNLPGFRILVQKSLYFRVSKASTGSRFQCGCWEIWSPSYSLFFIWTLLFLCASLQIYSLSLEHTSRWGQGSPPFCFSVCLSAIFLNDYIVSPCHSPCSCWNSCCPDCTSAALSCLLFSGHCVSVAFIWRCLFSSSPLARVWCLLSGFQWSRALFVL